MKSYYRVYTAWAPFGNKIGSKMVDQMIVYRSIGNQLPFFVTKKACQTWIDGDAGAKRVFGLKPVRLCVTVAAVSQPHKKKGR